MGKVFKQAVKVANRLVPQMKKDIKQEVNQSNPKIQKDVKAQQQKVTPKAVKRGVGAGEMEDPMAKAARKRGRRSDVMTGSRGLTTSAGTTKKTLLGG